GIRAFKITAPNLAADSVQGLGSETDVHGLYALLYAQRADAPACNIVELLLVHLLFFVLAIKGDRLLNDRIRAFKITATNLVADSTQGLWYDGDILASAVSRYGRYEKRLPRGTRGRHQRDGRSIRARNVCCDSASSESPILPF